MRHVTGGIVLLLLCGSLQAAAPRVALVANQRSDAVRGVLDLAEAELSADRDLVLLDRSANERILAEHELSLSGLVDANTVVAAGKLLSADLFAVVETDPNGKEALGLVIFEATTGIRLWDAALPAGDLKKTAAAAAAGVRAAVKKQAAGLKAVRTVCLLGVRNADLRPELDSFCQFVALLVERRLVSSDGVAVLERKRLDFVNRERALPTGAAEKELLASLVLIELEVRRAPGGNGLRAVAFLTDGKGKPLDRVTADVQEANAADLADPLVRGISQSLRVAPAQPAGDSAEGRSFLREAELMWSHQQLLQGLQAAESAQALDPAAPENQAVLAQYLLSYAVYLIDPRGMTSITFGRGPSLRTVDTATLRASLELALRGVETRANTFGHIRPRTRRSLGLDFGRNLPNRADLRSYVNKLLFIDPACYDAEGRRLLDLFRAAVDRLILDELDGWAEVARASPVEKSELNPASAPDSALSQYMGEIRNSRELLIWNSPDSATYTALLLPIMERWLKVSAAVDVNQYQTWQLTWFLDDMTGSLVAPFGASWELTADDSARLLTVFEGMERHPHPLVGLYGRAGQLLIGLRTRRLSPAEARAKFDDIRERAFDLIRTPPVRPADGFRVGCYKFLAYALERLTTQVAGLLNLHVKSDPALSRKELAPLQDQFYVVCDFMLDRGELVPQVIETTVSYAGGTVDYARKKLALLERAAALAGSPECRLFDGDRAGFKGRVQVQRDQVVALHPELAPKPGPGKADSAPWGRVQTLLEVGKLDGIQTFTAATVFKEGVYVVGGRPDGADSQIQLIRVPLGGGPPRPLGKAKIGLAANALAGSLHLTVTALCVDGSHAYVGTKSDGIIRFDLAGGPGKRIGPDEGLPATAVTAMDLLDGKVYACLEGGYLVAVSPGPDRVEVIASSRRKEKLSPFDDNASPFSVPCLAADPERHRLLFVLYQGKPSTANTTDGLWEYDAVTQAFKQRLRFGRSGTVTWGSRVRDGHILFSSPWFALRYDLARDQALLISGSSNPFPPGTRPDVKVAFTGSPPHLLRDGWLWVSYPFGRVALDDGRQETFPTFADTRRPNGFAAACLEPTGRADQVLIGSYTELYLVTLRAGETGEKAKADRP